MNLNIFRLGALPDNPTADDNVSKGSGSGVQDMSPASSPDGPYVAFTSNCIGNWEIYVGATDGCTQQRVTYTTTAANLSPMWSPDGKSIGSRLIQFGFLERNRFLSELERHDIYQPKRF